LGNSADALYDPLNHDYNHRPTVNVASIRFGIRQGAWDASIFSSNLLNSKTILNGNHGGGPSSDLFTAQILPPRVVGVTGTYRF